MQGAAENPNSMKLLIHFLFPVLFFSCNSSDRNGNPVIVKLPPRNTTTATPQEVAKPAFTYNLKTPTRSWKLPSPLVEVSGNAWVDKDHLLLIEDLRPNLYLIKLEDKNVVLEKTIPFQKDEKDKFDIEDVAIVNDVVYALWSHGILFKITGWRSSTPDVKEIPTFLTKKNNTEGLCYDPVTKSLLIDCKDESSIPDEKKSTKAVYRFDMTSEKADPKPLLVIRKHDFEKIVGSKVDFNPSAISVHPATQEIYILSTRGNKCMAVFDRTGKLKSFQFINKDLMPQPEGICFSPEGKLYISSEGKKGEPGNLFEFEPSK